MMQNELFYSYIDDSDKEFMAIEAAADIEIQKSILALEYADRLYDIKLKQAELKVLNESGTFEDLDTLYEAAGQENSERKEGILKTIWNKLLKFLTDIRTSIGNLFTKDKMKALETADGSSQIKDPNKILSTIKNAVTSAGKYLRPGVTVTNEDGEKVFSIGKSMITAIEGIGLVAFSIKGIPALYIKAKSLGDTLIKKCQELKDKPPLGDGVKALTQFFKSCSDKISELLKSLWNAASGFFKKSKKGENAEGGSAGSAGTDAIEGPTGGPARLTDKGAFTGSRLKQPKKVQESVNDDLGILESAELEESCDDIINTIDAILA